MKKKDRRFVIIMSAIIFVLVGIGFIVPVQQNAPSDARAILDHTTETYVSPSCFEEAEVTNFLQETTYGHALSLDYEPESTCTVNFYTESDVPLFIAMLRTLGIGEQKWTEEDIL